MKSLTAKGTGLLFRLSASVSLAVLAATPFPQALAQARQAVETAWPRSGFPQDISDLPADERVVYGRLENGLRYAVMRNSTPSGVAAIRMRIATGSWNETDEQRGIAHFLEHMAFNGSINVPEGEMIKRLERHGLAFGADTNASTGFDQTVYKLNLPTTSEEVLDEAFFLMRETASNLTLDAEAIDRERGVIAAEKSSRDSLAFRSSVDTMRFFTEGSGRVDRLPIGTDETIANMPREEFVRFYREYYRPENTFLVIVGDLDVEVAIAKIRKHFGDWRPETPGGQARPLVPATIEPGKIGYFQHPELLTYVTLATQYPYEKKPDTAEQRAENTLRNIANRIVDRRLGRMIDEGRAPFLAGAVGRYAQREIVDGAQIRVRADPGKWKESLAAADLEIRRALMHGFTQAEVDEQIALYRRSLETSVERANTRKTFANLEYNYVDAITEAFGEERVFTSPETNLALFERLAANLTVEDVERAFRKAWRGYETPTVYLSTSLEIADPEAEVTKALAEARAVEPEPPEDRDAGAFAYSDFGTPGEVVSEKYLADAEAWLIRFANNVRLNIKQTDFDAGTIYIQAEVGDGFFSMPRKDESLRRLAENLLSRSGVGEHTADDLRTLFAGKRVGATVRLRPDSDAITILGATDMRDLRDQLNLMTAHVVAPAYRETILAQYHERMRAWYPTHDSSPTSVADKEIPRLLRSGDERYGYSDLESFLAPTIEEVRDWLDPQLKDGLIEITIVGDFDRQTVIDEVARTFGALPERKDTQGEYPGARDLVFPPPPEEPARFYHNGTPDQALARVYWPGPDGTDPEIRYRTIILRSIFRNRLTEVLREELGSTYSPGVGIEANDEFEDYGYLFASVTVDPAKAEQVIPDIERVAAELAANGIDEDELKRAVQPLIEDLPSSLENNAYWVDVLSDAQTDGTGLAQFRAREAAYRTATVADIDALARRIFVNEKAYPILILPSREDAR